jgi:WD40 repeat protein
MLASASSDGNVIVWPVPQRAREEEGNEEGSGDKENNNHKENNPNNPNNNIPDGPPRSEPQRTPGVTKRTILTHLPPCYVYTCGFHPTADPPVLCTGAYDAQVRLWDVSSRDSKHRHRNFSLHSESASALANRLSGNMDSLESLSSREIGNLGRNLQLHKSRINALLFDKRGIRLFTGDGAGVVSCGLLW